MEFRNKVAVITGGSTGIGFALAQRILARGGKVALVARTQSTLEQARVSLASPDVLILPMDVNDLAATTDLPRLVKERFGGVDLLINNAGLNYRGAIAERSPEDLARVIQTNLVAPMVLSRIFLDHLRPGGAIVQIASLAGKMPFANQAAYCASKAGLRAFSASIHDELAPRDLHALCVNPGPVDTTFFGDIATVSNVTFSQPMSSPEQVADLTLAALAHKQMEADLPTFSGALATLGYLLPSLKRALTPLLETRGARNKERYMRQKGLLP